MKRQSIDEALHELEREGVLDASQRERVAARLGAGADSHADRSGRVAAVLAGMGAALVGAGLLYLVGYNWDELTRPIKLVLIFAVWGGLHFAGYRLARSPGNYPRLGTAITAIGVLSFGGAIALIAQIYNLSAHYPWSILLWAALNLPLVLLSGSVLLLTIVSGLFIVWSFWHAGVYMESAFGARYLDEMFLLAQLMLGLALGALVASLAGQCEGTRFANFSGPLRSVGRVLALGAIYVLTFDFIGSRQYGVLSKIGSPEWRSSVAQLLLPCAVAGAAAFACMTTRVSRPGGAGAQRSAIWIGLAGLLFALHFALAPQWLFVTANLVLLVAVGLLIQAGVRDGRASDINLGLVLFAGWLVSRYFEYLWEKLAAGTAAIGLGVLLLTVGFILEKRRRHWIAASQRGSA